MTDTSFDFTSDTTTLRGVLTRPEHPTDDAPVVVMALGLGVLKEWAKDTADAFAGSGITTLRYDVRGFGASDGTPRGRLDPTAQVRDLRNAVSALVTSGEVGPAGVGVWGSSYGGGVALAAAALDDRIGAVAVQVPLVDGLATMTKMAPPGALDGLRTALREERDAVVAGAEPTVVAQVTDDPAVPAIAADPDTWDYVTSRAGTTPDWPNQMTLDSVDRLLEFSVLALVDRVSAPTLVLIGESDAVCPNELTEQAFQRLVGPRLLRTVPGGHYDVYGTSFGVATASTSGWLSQHLVAATTAAVGAP